MNAIPTVFEHSPVDQTTINYLTANIPNPFARLLPHESQWNDDLTDPLLTPFPQFTGFSMLIIRVIRGYHSVQVRMERRFSKGFTAQSDIRFRRPWKHFYLNGGDPSPIADLDGPASASVLQRNLRLPVGREALLATGRIANASSATGSWIRYGN